MHELSVAQSIVDLVAEEARKAKAKKVLTVTLSIGELSGVVEEQLCFCLPIVAKDTVVQDAQFIVERVQGLGYCDDCRSEFHLPTLATPCPKCGEYTSDVRKGQDLRLTSLEVD